VADPIVIDDKMFISTGYGIGCTLLDISSGTPQVIWQNNNLAADVAPCVYIGGYLFGCHDAVLFGGSMRILGNLRCLDIKNGEVMWEKDLGQPVSLSVSGNRLLLLSEEGILHIAEAGPTGFKLISRCDILDGKETARKFWTPPVLCNGRIYCRNYTGDLICLDVRG
jgi:outer membrane protein assembly factor BamB